MPWNTIATKDVLTEFTPAEQAVLNGIQGGTQNLAAVLAKVINKVRGQIRAGGNQVDMTSMVTVPDQLMEEVIAIARWKWLNSFPALKSFKTDDRKQAAADAEMRLKDISSQKPDRERTEFPATTDATPVPIIQPSTGCGKLKHFRGRSEDGIV